MGAFNYRNWLYALALWSALLLVGWCTLQPARSHSWYDIECCSDRDCKAVNADSLLEKTDGGWRYLPTGTEFSKHQVRPSRDNHFHVCIGPGGKPHCVYILQGS